MASRSGTLPMAAENVQNLGVDQQEKEVQQDGKAEVDQLSSTTPLVVNLESVREEKVKNAVKFLSYPKVRGSPVIYRRFFLQKNGLTKEEIDEAFRRVPDPSPIAVASNGSQDGRVKSPSNNQLQASTQALQPSASAPTAPTTIVSSTGTMKGSEFHWPDVLIAARLLSISGAGLAFIIIKNKMIPKLKSWIRIVNNGRKEIVKGESSAAAAVKAASEATIDLARACQDLLNSTYQVKTWISQDLLNSKYQEMQKIEETVGLLHMQLQELKTLTSDLLGSEGDSGRTNYSGKRASGNFNPLHEVQSQGEGFSSTMQNCGMNYQRNDDDSASWGQQHNVEKHEQPIRQPGIPPSLPLISIPEAADSIQASKSTVQTETLANNQFVTPPDMASE